MEFSLKKTRIARFREVSLFVLDAIRCFLSNRSSRYRANVTRDYLREYYVYYGQWRIVEGSVGCAAITLCVVIKGHSRRSAV